MNQGPPPPFVSPTISIVGPPKSGKTFIATRIAREFDIVYLTVPIIVQTILDGKENTDLHDKVARKICLILFR